MAKAAKVVTIGGLSIDLTYLLVDNAFSGKKVGYAQRVTLEAGGKTFNCATALARLGMDVTMIATLGEDRFATDLEKALEAEKISTNYLVEVPNGKTIITSIMTYADPKQSHNFVTLQPDLNALKVQDIIKRTKVITGSDYVFANNEASPEVITASLQLGRINDKVTFFNPSPIFEMEKNIFPYVDFAVFNKSEIDFYMPNLDREQQVKNILDMGAKNVVLTLGKEGCVAGNRRWVDYFPAFKVMLINEVGSGDAFLGALIYAHSQGLDFRDMIKFSLYSAAIKCMHEEVRGGMPRLAQVKSFLDNLQKDDKK